MMKRTKRPPDKPEWTPHPNYAEYSGERLNLEDGLVQQEIDWASDDGDDARRCYYATRMTLLQAERARRNSGKPEPAPLNLELQPEALHGLAGEIVETILPHTEAHAVSLLVYLLAGFGNIIAHNPHWKMERTSHYLNLFAVLVGDTNRGRKGTSRSTLDYIFGRIDQDWRNRRIMSGLSSGQGLIWNVRDPVTEHRPIKERGKTVDYEDVVVDQGEEDKRLFIVEEEFSTVLKLAPVEGNILSAVIRQAWDSGNLRSLTSGRKSHPVKATDAHITILGHITKAELLRYLDSTEQANGFGNRFLWFVVERSKKIPNPKGTPDEILEPLIESLADSVSFAVKTAEIIRDEDAENVWTAAYDKLTEDGAGMVASMTARAAPQVMRLASIYALLDRSDLICVEHLKAAIALWDYANESTKMIFSDSLGDPTADRILEAISRGDGLSATDLYNLFSRHNSAGIDQALAWLTKMNRIEEVVIATGGRPKTVYHPKRRQP